jgi:hypothetical protein
MNDWSLETIQDAFTAIARAQSPNTYTDSKKRTNVKLPDRRLHSRLARSPMTGYEGVQSPFAGYKHGRHRRCHDGSLIDKRHDGHPGNVSIGAQQVEPQRD